MDVGWILVYVFLLFKHRYYASLLQQLQALFHLRLWELNDKVFIHLDGKAMNDAMTKQVYGFNSKIKLLSTLFSYLPSLYNKLCYAFIILDIVYPLINCVLGKNNMLRGSMPHC